jgi:hypothetical protein
MTKPKIILSQDKDIPILFYLWQWKVATTVMLATRFYGNPRNQAAYRRLYRLEKAGFIQTKSSNSGDKYVWTLAKSGFNAIRGYLPSLKEEGYRCENIAHDLTTNLVHLGDWLHGVPKGYGLFSEQQLRRYELDDYPSWVPSSDRHRPDGYWKIPVEGKERVFALEVELSIKRKSEYGQIAYFYEGWRGVYRVLWVVGSSSIAKTVDTEIKKSLGDEVNYHNFVEVSQFRKNSWRAKISRGIDAGESIEQMLGNPPSTRREPVEGPCMFDARKSPHKSTNCRVFSTADFAY